MTKTDAGNAPAHTRIGWFELFYDLIVVAAISQAGKVLVKDPSWASSILVIVSLTALFVVWLLTTLDGGMRPRLTSSRRLVILAQMFALILAALAVGKYGLPNWIGFTGLAVVFASLAFLFSRPTYKEPGLARPARTIVMSTIWSTALAAASAVISLGLDSKSAALIAPILILIAVAVTAVPTLTSVLKGLSHRISHAHLDERLSLLVIIVLGESFINLVGNLGMLGTIPNPVFFVLTFLVAYSLWWLYFSSAPDGRMPTSASGLRRWLMTHLLLVISLVPVASLLTAMTLDNGQGTVAWSPLPLLLALLALSLLSRQAGAGQGKVTTVETVALVALAATLVIDLITGGDSAGLWLMIASLVVIADAVAVALVRRMSAAQP